MQFPSITATYAAVLSLVFIALSVWVVVGRAQFNVHHGHGGDDRLHRRIRSHGNFIEYVPLVLLLAGLLEARGEAPWILHALLGTLLIARLIHPLGMRAPEASAQQYLLRAPSASATWIVLAAASVLLLL